MDKGRGTDTRISWLCFIGAVLFLLISNGADTVALAAWISPILLLRFTRMQRAWLGLPLTYIALVGTMAFQFRGMVPIPGIGYCIFLAAFGAALLLPYGLDRLLAPRLTGLAATLVFPAAWAFTEYLISLGPYGTWGSAAYSQYGDLPLLQLLSVTGLWGITFLIGWAAAIVNRCWEEGFGSRPVRWNAALCAAVIAGVMLLGGLRLAFFPPPGSVLRVASLSVQDVKPDLDQDLFTRMFFGQTTYPDLPAIRAWAAARDDDLMARAERELQAGAQLVFWSEINAAVLKEDEPAFLARGGALAAKYHAYLGMAVQVWDLNKPKPNENILVLMGPDGMQLWQFAKARPVPGGETAIQLPSDGKLKFADTPYGRMSGVICFDADFPQLLAQAGAGRTDLLLDPSSDWRAIDPMHTRMASYRAVEQGFNLVRQTSDGLSAAYDYQGHELSHMDHFASADRVMVSAVPVHGAATLYARFGDWFAWVCAALLLALGIKAFVPRKP